MMNLSFFIIFIIGLVIGFLIACFIKNKELKLEKKNFKQQTQNIQEIEDRFKTIASEVLRLNSQDFLQLAQKDLEKTQEIISTDFAGKEDNVRKLIKDTTETIEKLGEKISKFEKERGEQFGSIGESIKQVLETGTKMTDATLTLKTVLSSSGAIRGRWGETVLRNLLEESGLTEGIDFIVQKSISDDSLALLRPDIIINLPGNLHLAVDSKASLGEFFKAVEEKEDDIRKEHIEKFVSNLKLHIKNLSRKEYQTHLDKKIPYVVMFVPGEAAVRAAFQYDTDLYREAQEKNVILASPATIMPMILLIAHAWKQQKATENVVKLSSEITEFGNRLKVFIKHVIGIGLNIEQATKKYNNAVGSWEVKIKPKIDQINKMGGNIQLNNNPKLIEEKIREFKELPNAAKEESKTKNLKTRKKD